VHAPYWQTLQDARHAHSFLQVAALIFFGLLVIFEIRALVAKKHGQHDAEKRYEILAIAAFAVAVLLEIIALPYSSRSEDLADEKIAHNDPRNLAVSDITAKALVQVSGPLDGQPPAIVPMDFESYMTFVESNAPPFTLSFASFGSLYVSDVSAHETRSAGPVTHGYSINLKRDFRMSGELSVINGWTPASANMVMDRVYRLEFRLAFVPAKTEVLEGSVELLINGTFKKKFIIPHQICSSNHMFYATNSP